MNGTDHQMPQPWLGRVVAEANALQDDLDLRIVSLPEHLATVTTEGLPTWRGELRAGARANLLMGVTSNRVDVTPGRRPGRAGRSNAWPSRCRRCSCPRTVGRRPCSTRPGAT